MQLPALLVVDLDNRDAEAAQNIEVCLRVAANLRQGPDDEGGVFLTVDKGKGAASGLLGRIAADGPISITWNSTLSKISAFRGPDWPSAVRAWVAAGGKMTLRQAGLTAGQALIGAKSGTLTVGQDGRVRGVIDATLRGESSARSRPACTGARGGRCRGVSAAST